MALILASWRFADEPPGVAEIARTLSRQTGLESTLIGTGQRLRIPTLHEELFDWLREPHRVEVSGFAPAHPYLWENLDASICALGGEREGLAYAWQPATDFRGLRRPWRELGARDRWLLRLPSIGMSRPLDRFIRARLG